MINLTVKNKICNFENCEKIATFNYKSESKPIFCVDHKEEKMISISNRSKWCIEKDCEIRATYNYEDQKKPIYCLKHKKEDMVNIVSDICSGQGGNCVQRASKKFRGYCAICFKNEFPDDPLTKEIHQKSKELKVRLFLNDNYEGFVHDIPLWTANCACIHRRRIDHRKLIGNTLLCIETDENQHRNYDEKDEEIRYNDLYSVFSGKWIFIRFNPDSYKDSKGKRKNTLFNKRLEVLQEEINKQIQRIEKEENTELVEIIKLFYDEN
jgi:hypothetical protein